MPTVISHKGKALTLHKAVTSPHFNEKTVLVNSTWDYVDLWLKRAKKGEARFFWSQARSFHEATQNLPKTSAPLTAYYCFLNASKAFLLTRGHQFTAFRALPLEDLLRLAMKRSSLRMGAFYLLSAKFWVSKSIRTFIH
jgi:hypothetical protein